MPYKERSLYNDFQKLQSKAKNAGIPNAIIQEAKKFDLLQKLRFPEGQIAVL